MSRHPVEEIIARADAAINQEDFDALAEIYAEDAVLVIQPGMNARGKAQIKQAFQAIAQHFGHSLAVRQAALEVLAGGDTALVLAKTLVSAQGHPTVERKATYVFKKDVSGRWLCVIDNSYGHDLLEPAPPAS